MAGAVEEAIWAVFSCFSEFVLAIALGGAVMLCGVYTIAYCARQGIDRARQQLVVLTQKPQTVATESDAED
jgi:hypothetical protein